MASSSESATTCQQSSFLAAWYVSTGAWYGLAAAWLALALWPTRRRTGVVLGTLLLLGVLSVVMVMFKQTFHCALVGANGHVVSGKAPYENPRAFPSLEGGLAAYAGALALLDPALRRPWQLTQRYQRALLAGLAVSFATSLLWFHTPAQVALSLLLGAVLGAAWQRVLQRVLAEFPGSGGAIGSDDLHV